MYNYQSICISKKFHLEKLIWKKSPSGKSQLEKSSAKIENSTGKIICKNPTGKNKKSTGKPDWKNQLEKLKVHLQK